VETKRLLVTDEEGNVVGSLTLSANGDEHIPLKLSQGQLRALHAKCNTLDGARDSERGAARAAALDAVGQECGRGVEHFTELSSNEASWLLDHLETAIDHALLHGL